MIKSGRNGLVKWDPTGVGGATAVALMSIKSWKLSMKTPKVNVTCFQDQNSVFVPGLPDLSGSLTGFWNSEDMSVIEATKLTAPGYLILIPDTTDLDSETVPAPWDFEGPAYLDAEIDTSVEGAPALSGEILAAGSWLLPGETAPA